MKHVVLLIVLLLPGCTAPQSAVSDNDEVAPINPCDITLVCGKEYNVSRQGPSQVAVDLEFQFTSPTTCNMEAVFEVYSDSPRPVAANFEIHDDQVVAGQATGGLQAINPNPTGDSPEPQHYPAIITYRERVLEGDFRVIIAGMDIRPDEPEPGVAPFTLRIHCDKAFQLAPRISTDVILWEAGFMGNDAEAYRINYPISYWQTNQVDGAALLEDANHNVTLLAVNYENPQEATGTVDLAGNQSSVAWSIDGHFGDVYDGPPGEYYLTVNYQGRGAPDRLFGILGSFEETRF